MWFDDGNHGTSFDEEFLFRVIKNSSNFDEKITPVHAATTLEVFSLTLGVLALMVLKKHRLSEAFHQATCTMVCIVSRIVRKTRGIDKFLAFTPTNCL